MYVQHNNLSVSPIEKVVIKKPRGLKIESIHKWVKNNESIASDIEKIRQNFDGMFGRRKALEKQRKQKQTSETTLKELTTTASDIGQIDDNIESPANELTPELNVQGSGYLWNDQK